MPHESTGRCLAPALDWFSAWCARSGEAAPGFAQLKRMRVLPPLLEFLDGRPVLDRADWTARREEIAALLSRCFFGRLPAAPPTLSAADTVDEQVADGAVFRRVRLCFATSPETAFTVETMTPPGDGPFPVFLTQSNHRGWALIALSRGYLACVYPAADDSDESARFVPAYPECDWATIPRRAWLAGRALDYLAGRPEADPARVGITGHSRNGKQSLIATALDPRIGAVVSSSSGSGGSCPFRFVAETYFAESAEFLTRRFPDWFHPRLRFFSGREDRLPIDIHGLAALIAPRPCLFSVGLNDGCETAFAVEQNIAAAGEVYRFLGAPGRLQLRWRPGGHETCAEDVHAYLDFFDHAFGRGGRPFPVRLADGRAPGRRVTRPAPPPPGPETPVATRIRWSLGEPPARGSQGAAAYGREPEYLAGLLRRETPPEVRRLSFSFADYLAGDLYLPARGDGPWPVVIWAPPFSEPRGYAGAYISAPPVFFSLAAQGLAVFAVDPPGGGRRLVEGASFDRRFPDWSKMGRQVADISSAVDLVCARDRAAEQRLGAKWVSAWPSLDAGRVFCLGYGTGGLAALYAAALDPRVTGVASFSGFTSLRRPAGDRYDVTPLQRLGTLFALQPRLALFRGREAAVPFDFDEVLALVAPRPCLVVAPTHDWQWDPAGPAAAGCAARARAAWDAAGAGASFTFRVTPGYASFGPDEHRLFLDWCRGAGR